MLRLNIRISRKVGRTILSKPGIFFEETTTSRSSTTECSKGIRAHFYRLLSKWKKWLEKSVFSESAYHLVLKGVRILLVLNITKVQLFAHDDQNRENATQLNETL